MGVLIQKGNDKGMPIKIIGFVALIIIFAVAFMLSKVNISGYETIYSQDLILENNVAEHDFSIERLDGDYRARVMINYKYSSGFNNLAGEIISPSGRIYKDEATLDRTRMTSKDRIKSLNFNGIQYEEGEFKLRINLNGDGVSIKEMEFLLQNK